MAHKFGVSLSTVKFWEQDGTQPAAAVRAHVEAFLNTASVDNFLKTQCGTSIDRRVGQYHA
jgi:transcriptional regulator with XRE-family HTH domain